MLREEIHIFISKVAIQVVPQGEYGGRGFCSRYFLLLKKRGGGGWLKNAYVTCHALCNASSELAHISWFTLCISFSIKLLCNDLCREIHYTNKPELN